MVTSFRVQRNVCQKKIIFFIFLHEVLEMVSMFTGTQLSYPPDRHLQAFEDSGYISLSNCWTRLHSTLVQTVLEWAVIFKEKLRGDSSQVNLQARKLGLHVHDEPRVQDNFRRDIDALLDCNPVRHCHTETILRDTYCRARLPIVKRLRRELRWSRPPIHVCKLWWLTRQWLALLMVGSNHIKIIIWPHMSLMVFGDPSPTEARSGREWHVRCKRRSRLAAEESIARMYVLQMHLVVLILAQTESDSDTALFM